MLGSTLAEIKHRASRLVNCGIVKRCRLSPDGGTRMAEISEYPALDYLIIAPHPDDAELGVGGTMLLLKAQGASVGVLDLTDGEPTPHGSPEIRRRETEAATALLGLDWRGNLGLPNRSIQADLESRRRLA